MKKIIFLIAIISIIYNTVEAFKNFEEFKKFYTENTALRISEAKHANIKFSKWLLAYKNSLNKFPKQQKVIHAFFKKECEEIVSNSDDNTASYFVEKASQIKILQKRS